MVPQVSKGDAPFLILHGDRDPSVPLDQSERLHEALSAVGVPSTLRVVTGGGHGGAAFEATALKDLVREFLGEQLRTGQAGDTSR